MKLSSILLTLLADLTGLSEFKSHLQLVYQQRWLTKTKETLSGLSEDAMDTLETVYDMFSSVSGGFMVADTFVSTKTIGSSPEASSQLLVLYKGECGDWARMPKDRLFLWHKGEAMIDTIDENGNYLTRCLGDTLSDEECHFLVDIPSNWTVAIIPKKYAVFTSVNILGKFQDDGVIIPYNEMVDAYPELEDVIAPTRQCYVDI